VHYAAAVEVARVLGNDSELANALYNLFFARRPANNADEWFDVLKGDDTELLDEALTIWTRLGDEEGMGKALWGLSEWYGYRGDFAQAEVAATRALEIFERIGNPFWVSWSRFTRAFGRVLAHDVEGAARDLAPTLREFWAGRDLSGLALVLSGLATVLLMQGREVEGYEIGGAARRLISETGLHLATLWPASEVPTPEPDTASAELQAAFARGNAWTRDEVVERSLALADTLASGAPTPT
jgi:tetratricopeptide (TPR) repeat protein